MCGERLGAVSAICRISRSDDVALISGSSLCYSELLEDDIKKRLLMSVWFRDDHTECVRLNYIIQECDRYNHCAKFDNFHYLYQRCQFVRFSRESYGFPLF